MRRLSAAGADSVRESCGGEAGRHCDASAEDWSRPKQCKAVETRGTMATAEKKGVGLRRRTAAGCARGQAYVGYVAVKVVARERARLDAELKVLGELRRRIQEKNGDMISCRGRSVRRGESKMGDWGARFAETGSCAGLPRWSDNRIKAKCAPR